MRIPLLAVLLLLSLTACTPSPVAGPTPSATATPAFASDDEALAAATKVYKEYVRITNQISNDGGQDADRLRAVASGDFLESALEGFSREQAKGWHSIGGTALKSLSLQEYSADPAQEFVTLYSCEDVSEVDVVDATGQSVVSPDRPDLTAFEVKFDFSSGQFLITDRQVWSVGSC